MYNKFLGFIFSVFILLNTTGCLLVAGAAGGAGTAVWLSGKVTQEFHVSYDRAVKGARNALGYLKLDIAKETKEDTITQFKSKYSNGKEIWVDVRKITDNSVKIEVRVGAVNPDKEAADKILKAIQQHI